MEFGTEKCVILPKKTRKIEAKERTSKLRKNQNTGRKWKLQVLKNIGVRMIKQWEMKEKMRKVFQRKISQNQTRRQKSQQKDKLWGSSSRKILGTILKMNKR